MERRLSAILAADVVGYSALMEQDEAGTFDRLRAHRKELFEPEIEKHHGRIFKLTGDGLFVEFVSVVGAVECAVALQRGLTERNANISQDQRIDLRIGINLGKVIVEGDDRLGEGVNIAARLQQLAEPGGICVSGKVTKEVDKRLALGFEPMGEQKVKNISEQFPVFKVKMEGIPRRITNPRKLPPWTWGSRDPSGDRSTRWRVVLLRAAEIRFCHGSFYRRLAVRQHERRSQAQLLQRWCERGHHLHAGPITRPFGRSPEFLIHLQRQGHGRAAGRQGTRYWLRARRERA
jgi:class 3 adenylate cyclase